MLYVERPSNWNPLFTNAGRRHLFLVLDRSGIGVLTLQTDMTLVKFRLESFLLPCCRGVWVRWKICFLKNRR